MKLAENLLFLRKQKKVTQEELAEIFNVSAQSISKWELGINCPDITMLPKIAKYYGVSIDELLGYKNISSLNSLYIDIKSYIDNSNDKIEDAYKISRLAISAIHDEERKAADRLLNNKRDYSLSYGQNEGGVTICGDQSTFICSFKDLNNYDISTIRKVSKYLNKINDLNTLKVLFALFALYISNVNKFNSIDEICEKANLDESIVNRVLNNLDVVFDKDEFEKTGIEKYSLAHVDQVPILIALLIPALSDYNCQIVD